MAKDSVKILIAGDSFAAKWPGKGWPDLLSEYINVTNLAQAGVGEYKILEQIKSANLQDYSAVRVCHTSPSRVHTRSHPIHKTGLHENCDLIWTDLESHKDYFNSSLKAAKGYFQHHYDDQYYKDIYSLIRKEISNIIDIPYISVDNLKASTEFKFETNSIDFSDYWLENRGNTNHFNEQGNSYVCQTLLTKLKSIGLSL